MYGRTLHHAVALVLLGIYQHSLVFLHAQQVPDAKIVQSWRFVDWQDGVASTVTFEFSSTQYGVTSLKVRQTGVPDEDKFGHRGIVPKVTDGWNSKFFTPISKVLGFAFYTEDDDD